MGEPEAEETYIVDRDTLIRCKYSYVEVAPGSAVAQARVTFVYFDHDTLAGYNYSSSFKDDDTYFDESKLQQILVGSSTREDVVKFVGEPTGEQVYPLANELGTRELVWGCFVTRTYGAKLRSETKSLVVTVNGNGVVLKTRLTRVIPIK
jgi:hypothetical protein